MMTFRPQLPMQKYLSRLLSIQHIVIAAILRQPLGQSAQHDAASLQGIADMQALAIETLISVVESLLSSNRLKH